MSKHRVYLREYTDYFQEEWCEDYATEATAQKRIEEVNTSPRVGEGWFIQAKEKSEVVT